jgi:sarcosine oxidase
VDTFDAVIIGLGAHGSAAALALSRRGLRVAGLERFGRAHGLASSGGRTRIIRMAYFEGPAYVPLVLEAWDRWQALEAEAGVSILTQTGGIYGGLAGSAVLDGSTRSAREHGLPHEVIDADELRRRWPVFAPPEGTLALIEERAGVLRSDVAIEAQLAVAERLGAVFRFDDQVMDWRPAAGGGYEVECASGAVVGAELLVIAAGAWTTGLLRDVRLPLRIERVPLLWVEPVVSAAEVGVGRLPVWIMETDFDGAFYGFPYEPGAGLKVARHHSEDLVAADALDTLDRALTPADEARVRRFLRAQMPGADGPLRDSAVCLYTDTPDEDFVLDTHPAGRGIAFASACSGHGFKFSPVIGEILADLAMEGATAYPVDTFRAARFAAWFAA